MHELLEYPFDADEILKKSDDYCDAYMEEVKKNVQKEIEAYEKKAKAERNLLEEKTKSGAEFLERNSILRAKQECIDSVISQAESKIENLPAEEYFHILEKILEANVQSGDGVMYFGKRDIDRIPEGFSKRVEEIAKAKGGTIKIHPDAVSIGDGFVLAYGEIEENCTIKALFDSNTDRLKDIVGKELFG